MLAVDKSGVGAHADDPCLLMVGLVLFAQSSAIAPFIYTLC